MESGWDPQVSKFFRRILNSISLGLIWMMSCATAGLYFKLGHTHGQPIIYPILFYTIAVVTLFLLIRYLIKIWK
jgi:hypothetical protein